MKNLFAKFVDKPLNFIDSGNFFKKGLHYYLILISVGILIGGVYTIITGLFGDGGYVDQMEFTESGIKVRSYIASIFTFLISLASVVVVALIFYKRANDLQKKEYSGILQYLYKDFFPTIIKIYGESLAILPIFLSLITFFSVLLVGIPFSPIDEISRSMFGYAQLDFMSDAMSSSNPFSVDDFGDYIESFLKVGIGGFFTSLILSFSMLIITHIALEVYGYLVKIIINLVNFIPKFALPLWVQKSDRYNKKPTIDINDL